MNANNGQVVIKTGGFSTLLTILFIALKLTGQIAWSWLWVLAPLWIPTAIFILILLGFLGLWLLGSYLANR